MKYLLGLLTALLFSFSVAAETAPDVLVKSVTNEVLDTVRQDKDIRNGNSKKVLDLVETKILPHFDFFHMTRLALGREGRQATPEQMKVLVEEFRTLLVRTYSKALTEYRDQEIVFKPFKMAPTDTDVRVRTEVKQSGGKPVSIDYYLEKSGNGWKVYDIEVAGASLVTNYRSTFAQEIQKGGVDGLIKTLQEKNRTGEAVAAKAK
ncbi:MAG: phospholipid-binding protein MlaC [Rhodocyclaceae bacterium]